MAVKPITKFMYLFIILAFAGLLAAVYMYNKPQKNMERQNADFTVTATDLQMEFQSDEAAAHQKYLGKNVEVTGKIISVNIEEDKVVSIILETPDEMSSVICTFSEKMDPKAINPSKPVKVRGELSGFLMDVLLNNCVLIN